MIALPKFDGLRAIASLLYPPVCTICGANVRAGEYLCSHCESKTIRIVAPFCQTCSEPFEGAITGAFICANCAHRTIHFDAAVAAYRSRGIVRELIHDFKYRRQIYLRHLVARWLCAAMNDERVRARSKTRRRYLRLCGNRRTCIIPWPFSRNQQLKSKIVRSAKSRRVFFRNVLAVPRSCRKSSSRKISVSVRAAIIILRNRQGNGSKICSTPKPLWRWMPT